MRSSIWTSGLLVAAATVAVAVPARAQKRPSPVTTAPAGAGGQAGAQGGLQANVPPGTNPGDTETSATPMAVPNELMQTHPEGLTADQVGRRAMETSFNAKQALETMHAAEARIDQQWSAFLPRLTGTARYTRLSSFTPPDLFGGSPYNSVATTNPGAPGTGILPGNAELVSVPNVPLVIPLVLDNYLLQANITIPISDYFLRTNENYSAATHSAEATRFDLGTARAKALSDGKVAYYTWLLDRGAVVVAVQALNDQRTHLNDARNQFTVGNASRADVLRAETNAASAELQVVTARYAADLAETQMRIAMHYPPGQALQPAEGLDVTPPSFQGNLRGLVDEALTTRLEVKSVDENALAAHKQAAGFNGGRYPAISAFGDGIYGNPNPRIFPQTQSWFGTWDLGLQAIWSPNDTITNGAVKNDYEARARALEAQRQVTREGIEVEVTQTFQQVKQYDFALDSTRRQLASAQEAYRVARELFNNGRGTSTTLADAETELTRARLDALNATVNARVARVKLDHAVGRDVRVVQANP